jgi:redox-sensitive bicupin YhaK (pirin superfamily)
MITVKKSEERRHIVNDNQNTWMTFDQENIADPLHTGFCSLKIFNEEILNPCKAFILHTHKDIVIVTYVHDGVVIFNAPMGDPNLMESGDFGQINSISGSKNLSLNASPSDFAHLFQSGFSPASGPMVPSSEKMHITLAERKGILKLIASSNGEENSLKINQNIKMYSTLIHKGNHIIHELVAGRNAWLHVVKGRIILNEWSLQAGDGAGFTDEMSVSFTAMEPTEILLFDLPSQIEEPGSSSTDVLQNLLTVGT